MSTGPARPVGVRRATHCSESAVARGYTNTTIAEQLHLSPKTVRNYVSTILRKMQVPTRIAAALNARQAGLD